MGENGKERERGQVQCMWSAETLIDGYFCNGGLFSLAQAVDWPID